jgi:cystathionine beta-lyase/cystathionine gamma-synthase
MSHEAQDFMELLEGHPSIRSVWDPARRTFGIHQLAVVHQGKPGTMGTMAGWLTLVKVGGTKKPCR